MFYNLGDYLKNPLEILAVWHGGMSFHGGLIGSIVTGVIFCIRHKLDFWMLSDLVIVTAPIGLGLGRLGNFILYGIFRFFVEFFREPDPQLGFIFSSFTMGQILSGIMFLIGVRILFYKRK